MKIVVKDNLNRDLFTERVIAEKVDESFGEEFVKAWNDKNWSDNSEHFIALVPDDYVPYDGYAQLIDGNKNTF
ncbi:hypothetical protein [Lysinibacillus xylanilyticus]|uniref:hypothetical protein n=1 Tax=Lysinibacillus xylanilyticus TaxID=582475 RepID=UPI0036DDB5A4